MRGIGRRIVVEGVGWFLVVAGVAALILPGPGLLLLAAGLAVLSQQYAWAERRLEPIRARALQTAEDGVRTRARIAGSLAAVAGMVVVGVFWIVSPTAPAWWPIHDRWWLPGGWATGVTILLSAAIALMLLGYSLRRVRSRTAAEATSASSASPDSLDGSPALAGAGSGQPEDELQHGEGGGGR